MRGEGGGGVWGLRFWGLVGALRCVCVCVGGWCGRRGRGGCVWYALFDMVGGARLFWVMRLVEVNDNGFACLTFKKAHLYYPGV